MSIFHSFLTSWPTDLTVNRENNQQMNLDAQCQWKSELLFSSCLSGSRSHSTNSSTFWWGSSWIRLRRRISRWSKMRDWFWLVSVIDVKWDVWLNVCCLFRLRWPFWSTSSLWLGRWTRRTSSTPARRAWPCLASSPGPLNPKVLMWGR